MNFTTTKNQASFIERGQYSRNLTLRTLSFQLLKWWFLFTIEQNLLPAFCWMLYPKINNVHKITVFMESWKQMFEKGKIFKCKRSRKKRNNQVNCQNLHDVKTFCQGFIFLSKQHLAIPNVGGDPSKQPHQEWQVEGPSWPFCSMCIHIPAPAKHARALFDCPMPALIPACRAIGQQIIMMGTCGEKRRAHVGRPSQGCFLKEDQN